eukprot:gene17065-biopygen4851
MEREHRASPLVYTSSKSVEMEYQDPLDDVRGLRSPAQRMSGSFAYDSMGDDLERTGRDSAPIALTPRERSHTSNSVKGNIFASGHVAIRLETLSFWEAKMIFWRCGQNYSN